MDLNVTHLTAFRAVAEAKNFTKAATELGVSQPAVSKQVMELERTVGLVLLERGRRHVTMTEAGETLLPYARRLAETLTDAKAALADLSALRRGRLRLGATPTLATYFLPRAMVYFRQRFPAVDVSVAVRGASGLFENLSDGRLDTVLSGRRPDGADTASRVFMTDALIPVCSAEHEWARGRAINATRLGEQRLVLRDGARGTAGYVERVLRARGVAIDRPLRLPHTESVKQAALAGLGVAFLPGVAVTDDLAGGRLRKLKVNGLRLMRSYHVAERPRPTQAMRAFACVLKHAVRGSLPAVRPAVS